MNRNREDIYGCWADEFDRESAKRRVRAIVREWRETLKGAQIATCEALESWLCARLHLHLEKWRTWPTNATMRGWARQYARSAGFHGSNARRAGEVQQPLREIPVLRIADEEVLEAVAARRTPGKIPYALRERGRTSDEYDDPE